MQRKLLHKNVKAAFLSMLVLCVAAISLATPRFAQGEVYRPPNPVMDYVPQNIGIMDKPYRDITEPDCKECHGESTAFRHHNTEPALLGDCLACHVGYPPPLVRDCQMCHTSDPTVYPEFYAVWGDLGNPHHKTDAAAAGQCNQCHDPNLIVEAYSVPPPSYAPGPNTPTPASCENCHFWDDPVNPTIHGTGHIETWGSTGAGIHPLKLALGFDPDNLPSMGTHEEINGMVYPQCALCHWSEPGNQWDTNPYNPQAIRFCENCHTMDQLHANPEHVNTNNIYTVNGVPNQEVTSSEKCMACHGTAIAIVPTGTNVNVTPAPEINITFNEVTSEGTISAAEVPSPTPPANFEFMETAYEITTTATYTGPNTVCFNYDDTGLTLSQENSLVLLHYEDLTQTWEDITSSRDSVNNIVCGVHDSLSLFVIAIPIVPSVGQIDAPIDPVKVYTSISASASFSDPGVPDTHTAQWDWGDGSISDGTINESNGSGTLEGSHVYNTPGVYSITLKVINKYGRYASAIYQYIVVYDPEGGFVTGGGWINSPQGAYIPDPSLTGKANFGFVSKYKKGATVPTGNTEFQFKVADLNFHSETYQWLVIAGAKAQYKGTGTINGKGNYGFMLTAIDGALRNDDKEDKFRIKIWDKDNYNVLVYDNQLGDSDDSDPTTIIGGGSIIIHKK